MKRSREFRAVAVLLGIGLCCVVYRSVRTRHEAPAAPATAGARRPVSEAAAPTQAELLSPEARAEDERRHRKFVAALKAKFRDELRDPQWSAATAAAVQTALASDDDLRPLARGVECRSQTCRVEIADDGSDKLGKLLPMFAMQVGPFLPCITVDRVEGVNGAATMVLYMSRHFETASVP